VQYLLEAVDLVAREGWRLLPDYRFDPSTGLWQHRAGPVEPPLRLDQVTYDADGRMEYRRERQLAPESALAEYLASARALLAASTPGSVDEIPDQAALSEDFEALRWFVLPPGSATAPVPADDPAMDGPPECAIP
jgi:hypothetical protein